MADLGYRFGKYNIHSLYMYLTNTSMSLKNVINLTEKNINFLIEIDTMYEIHTIIYNHKYKANFLKMKILCKIIYIRLLKYRSKYGE